MVKKRGGNDARAKAPLRPTELFFGVIGPLGIDLDALERALRKQLRAYEYKLETIRLSALLKLLKLSTAVVASPEGKRLESAMDAGNEARRLFGYDILAMLAVAQVLQNRPAEKAIPRQARKAYLFRSFKHPKEVEFARKVYGSSFFLIGAYATKSARIEHLKKKGLKKADAVRLLNRDEEEPIKEGQNARATFHLADVFVRPGFDDGGGLSHFLEVVFGNPRLSPTQEEQSMFQASAAALRSGDLSRQVGAAIVTESGDVVAVGANDVPRFGGGLYWPGPKDMRDAVKGYDSNERELKHLSEVIAAELLRQGLTKDEKGTTDALKGELGKSVTEFGRTVHAEMEALLDCARNGIHVKGCDLFTTTFPCHNCAKHIIGAGIRRVTFIEPYPKSKAFDLHHDAMAGDDEKAGERLEFRPFIGIGPRRYVDLFSMKLGTGYALQRKRDGVVPVWIKREAIPRIAPLRSDARIHRVLEKLATAGLQEIGSRKGATDGGHAKPK